MNAFALALSLPKEVRKWLTQVGVKDNLHNTGKFLGKWYNERFNDSLRDELLNGDIFYTLREAKILIENWHYHYNEVRPHKSLNYKPPAPK